MKILIVRGSICAKLICDGSGLIFKRLRLLSQPADAGAAETVADTTASVAAARLCQGSHRRAAVSQGGGSDRKTTRRLARFVFSFLPLQQVVVDNKHSNDYVLVVHVTFRLGRTWGVPIGAELSCPDGRAIVMRSWTVRAQANVVESHATPRDIDAEVRRLPIMTKVSIAYLDRPGFSFARWIAPLIKPGIWRTTRKLRVDDLATAERYESDQRSEFPG